MSETFKKFRIATWLHDVFGIDFHVLHTLLLRGWGILAGGLTVLLIPLGLTATEQGYYYVFASILALQIFFELGLNQVIVQLVSHEAAHLQFLENGTVVGDSERLNKLDGIIGFIRRWYTYAAILFLIVASILGWGFLSSHHGLTINQWAPTWCLLVFFTSINLYLSPRLAIIEGTGAVGNVARMRLSQSIFGNLLLWSMLVMGGGLWATLVVPFSSAIISILWLNKNAKWIAKSRQGDSFSWRKQVFPLQWRIGLSWMSGYILFNLFTPITFSTHGAVEAGRLGLAISIFNAITALGMSWVSARGPQFTMHISRGEFTELNSLFRKSSIQASIFTGLLALFIVTAVYLLEFNNIKIANRISTSSILIWLALGSVLNTFIFAAATYMRAYREEPMLAPSITGAVITLIFIYLTKDNISTMMMTNTAIIAFIGLPWVIYLLQDYLGRNHDQ